MELSGRVRWKTSGSFVTGAIVSIDDQPTSSPVRTDSEGIFKIAIPDAGKSALIAFHEDGRILDKTIVDAQAHDLDSPVDIFLMEDDKLAGPVWKFIFFWLPVLILGVLVVLWIRDEYKRPQFDTTNLLESTLEIQRNGSSWLSSSDRSELQVHIARIENIAAPYLDNVKTDSEGVFSNTLKDLSLFSVNRAEQDQQVIKTLQKDLATDDRTKSLIDELLKNPKKKDPDDYLKQLKAVKDALTQDQFQTSRELLQVKLTSDDSDKNDLEKSALQAVISRLQGSLPSLARHESEQGTKGDKVYQWISKDNMSITILFWAMIGTLVHLIMKIQGYIRFGRLYLIGAYQHIALFIVVPLITFVFVSFLSSVSIQSGDDKLIIDFSDPEIVALSAFLISLSPWLLWGRLKDISKSLIGD